MKAKKAMFVFQRNNLSVDAAKLIGDMALLSGHIGKPREGVLELMPKNNSQGLIDIGVKQGAEALKGAKALFVFGEDPVGAGISQLRGLELLVVSDTHMTKTAKKADVVIPGTGFASADGTYTSTERRLLPVEAAIDEDVIFSNFEIASELAHIFEADFGFEDEFDISEEMDAYLPKYKYAEIGECLCDVLEPYMPKLEAAGDGELLDKLPCTDNLMNMINERLPKHVKPTL